MGNRTLTFKDEKGNKHTYLVDPTGFFIRYWIGTKLIF